MQVMLERRRGRKRVGNGSSRERPGALPPHVGAYGVVHPPIIIPAHDPKAADELFKSLKGKGYGDVMIFIPADRVPPQVLAKGRPGASDYLNRVATARWYYDQGRRGSELANALRIEGKNEKSRKTIALRLVRQASRLGLGKTPADAREILENRMPSWKARTHLMIALDWCKANGVTLKDLLDGKPERGNRNDRT